MTRQRMGLGYDVHPFDTDAAARPLILGGVVIDGAPGLVGHSDGDAVAHAVGDALLGPCGLGDLGSLFPASDDRYRDADSIELLREIATKVRAAGWCVENVDVVIAAEQPKLAPFVAAMAANVSAALSTLARDAESVFVSVQPKRGEGVGFVGRAEGIAVWAVAMLVAAPAS